MPKKSSKKGVKFVKTSGKKHKQEVLEAEMLEGIEHESDLPPPRRGRWFALLGIIIAIGLSAYLVFAPIQHVVFGQLTSQSIADDSLSMEEYSIRFADGIGEELAFLYDVETTRRAVETSVCLLGEKRGSTYFVSEIFYPLITHQSYTEVSFKACPQDTVIMLHTHPYKQCKASRTDINTLKSRQEVNPDMLMIVMCEENRYAIYS